MGFLLTNHFVQGPEFEDLKEDTIVEVCPQQTSWILGLTSIIMISSLLSMLVGFHRICFLQDQGLPIFSNSSIMKGIALQNYFFSNDNHCNELKNCIELGSLPDILLFATSNKFNDRKSSQWGGSFPNRLLLLITRISKFFSIPIEVGILPVIIFEASSKSHKLGSISPMISGIVPEKLFVWRNIISIFSLGKSGTWPLKLLKLRSKYDAIE